MSDIERLHEMLRLTGGSAFPAEQEVSGGGTLTMTGLTVRDYFAAQALTGLLAANATYSGVTHDRAALAGDAYAHADAMLQVRQP